MNSKTSNVKKGAEAAFGLAALAAAAGAYYFYGSKESQKHRKQMKAWAVKAKGEMMEKLEDMQSVSKEAYDKAVTEVMAKYKTMKKAPPKELEFLAKELKSHWKNISAQLKPKAKAKSPQKAKRK